MPSNTYPLIAKEGWPCMLFLLGLALLSHFFISSILAILFLVFCLALVILLRDPVREIPSLPLAVISPVYGRIVSIESVTDPCLERTAKRIRIKMSLTNIYSLRSSIEGKVMEQWMKPMADSNSRGYAFWVRSDEGDDIVTMIHLTKKHWCYRIYVQSGERLGHGQRCGFLYLGSMVDVYLPENVKVDVEPGQIVESGSSVIAHIVHDSMASAVSQGEQEQLATPQTV